MRILNKNSIRPEGVHSLLILSRLSPKPFFASFFDNNMSPFLLRSLNIPWSSARTVGHYTAKRIPKNSGSRTECCRIQHACGWIFQSWYSQSTKIQSLDPRFSQVFKVQGLNPGFLFPSSMLFINIRQNLETFHLAHFLPHFLSGFKNLYRGLDFCFDFDN